MTHFKAALEGHWEHIPLLNDAARADEIAPGSLVRFRCMVQVWDPLHIIIGSAPSNQPARHAGALLFLAPPWSASFEDSLADSNLGARKELPPPVCHSSSHNTVTTLQHPVILK